MAGGTRFDNYDHVQLKAMVSATNASTVLSRGTQLREAGQALKDLSAALKSHVDNVEWEGPAAESFKTWAGSLHKSAALLGDYSTNAGEAMHQAGEALSTAQVAVPEPPHAEIAAVNRYSSQSPFTHVPDLPPGQSADAYLKAQNPNWVTAAEAQQAAAKVEKERQEAVHQMEKLTQAYSAATATLNSLEEPQLPGTPGQAKPRENLVGYSAGGGGSTTYSGDAVRRPRSASASSGSADYILAGGRHSGGEVALRQPASGPQRSDTPGRADPISSHGGGYVPLPQEQDASTVSSIPPLPVDRPGTGLDSLPTVPTLPSQSSPVGPVDGGNLPFDGLGGLPGRSGGPGGGGDNPGFPIGGSVPVGGLSGKGGSVPARSGGSILGKSGGALPGRPVPFGGGSLPGKTGTPGLPTGTVFGSREAQPGHAGASGMPGMGGMHPGAAGHGLGGAGGGTRGRGLTWTPGGIVGGHKGPSASGEFTPGGTGLRRQAGAVEGSARSGQNGMMAPGTHGGGAGRNGRDRRQRSDYLHEDEETWTSGTPHSNPNVVE